MRDSSPKSQNTLHFMGGKKRMLRPILVGNLVTGLRSLHFEIGLFTDNFGSEI